MNNIITPDLSGYGAQVIEENGRFALTYWPYCTKCKSPFQFDAGEPFAYCSCGTTEWGDPRPASWVHPLAEAQEQPVHHLMNPWQRAIDEALIVNCLDCTHASESPERALARLIRAEVDMALNLPVDNGSTERPDMSQTTETTLRAQLAEAQRDAERLDLIIEHRAYVVSDPDSCEGYWLNYARLDGTVWTQATEHETPRAAIDAAMGEPS